MLNKIKFELQELFQFFEDNYHEVVIIFTALAVVSIKRYAPVEPSWLNFVFYYIVIPIIVILVFLRKNPMDFGLRIGNAKRWGIHVVVAGLITIPVMYLASKGSDLNQFYSKNNLDFLKYTLEVTAKLIAWEFLLRGFLLFGLKNRFKESSILIQTIPFVLLHFGKPLIEVLACIPMGIYFGFVAYKGESMWPAFLIHLIINLSLTFFSN